jgi:hypothetical protein
MKIRAALIVGGTQRTQSGAATGPTPDRDEAGVPSTWQSLRDLEGFDLLRALLVFRRSRFGAERAAAWRTKKQILTEPTCLLGQWLPLGLGSGKRCDYQPDDIDK